MVATLPPKGIPAASVATGSESPITKKAANNARLRIHIHKVY